MNEQRQRDEALLIDLLTDQLDEPQQQQVRRRLETDEDFARLHRDLARTFAAWDAAGDVAPPADLVEHTLERVASARRTDALLALQQAQSPFRIPSTFSARELLAVAAVVLVMIGVLVPSLHPPHRRSRRSLCAAGMGEIGSALQTFAVNHDNTLPHVHSSCPRWLPGNKPHASNSAALFQLLKNDYLQNPVVFQCPARGGKSFSLRPEINDFPRPEHIQYSYNYSLAGHHLSILDPVVVKVADQLAILADQTPLFRNGAYRPDQADNPISENHDQRGQNVLYVDGHVLWNTSPHAGVHGDNIFFAAGTSDYDGDEQPAHKTDSFLLPAHPHR